MANVFDLASAAGPEHPNTPPLPGPPLGPPLSPRVWGYAGFWWRVLAWAVDSVLISLADGLIHLLVGEVRLGAGGGGAIGGGALGGDGPVSHISDIVVRPDFALPGYGAWQLHGPGVATLLGLLIQLGYFTLLESSRWQATVGKRACGLRVTRLDGGRISLGRALGRYFAKFLSALILFIGFGMIAWTRRKQGLHDLLAETLVVRLRPPSDLVRFNPPA